MRAADTGPAAPGRSRAEADSVTVPTKARTADRSVPTFALLGGDGGCEIRTREGLLPTEGGPPCRPHSRRSHRRMGRPAKSCLAPLGRSEQVSRRPAPRVGPCRHRREPQGLPAARRPPPRPGTRTSGPRPRTPSVPADQRSRGRSRRARPWCVRPLSPAGRVPEEERPGHHRTAGQDGGRHHRGDLTPPRRGSGRILVHVHSFDESAGGPGAASPAAGRPALVTASLAAHRGVDQSGGAAVHRTAEGS